VPDVVAAFGWGEPVEQSADGLPQRFDGALGGVVQEAFEFRKGKLDRVQIGAIGRQIEALCVIPVRPIAV
jgi:hypothetical protein